MFITAFIILGEIMEFLVVLLYFGCLIFTLVYINFGKFERKDNTVFSLILLAFGIFLPDALEYYLFENIAIIAFGALTILFIVYGYGELQKEQKITTLKRYLNGYLLGIFISFGVFYLLTNMYIASILEEQIKIVMIMIIIFYNLSMSLMLTIKRNFFNSKYTFLITIIVPILLIFPIIANSVIDVVNHREKIENNNQIDADQINEESVNYILEHNYEKNQIILSSKQIAPLAMWTGMLQEPQFDYDGFRFTDEDIEYIEGIDGVESATIQTNLHGLIKNQFTLYDYDQLTSEQQNQYTGYYLETLENYYPDMGSFVDISLDNSEAGYNHVQEEIQVVDINNPNPLSDSFVKHIYYDYSQVNILTGDWPTENNQILVPNLLVDAYSLYDNDITIDNVVGKTVINSATNEELTVVGVYDTAAYIGDDYELIHYGFSSGNTFVAHRIPPIFEYFSDEYLREVDETLYEIVTGINNLYYNGEYLDAENKTIDENYISPFDYEDFTDNEIVITLSEDAKFDKIEKKLSKNYPQNYYVYENLGVENVYDMA